MDQHDSFKPLGTDELGRGHTAADQAGTGPFEALPVPPGRTPPFEHPKLGGPSWQFEYRGIDGVPQGYVCRFESCAGKTFRPLRYGQLNEHTDWHWQGWAADRPLYHVLQLLAQPTALVLVVEGEKKVHAAQRMFAGGLSGDPAARELVAVAPMGGAQSPHKTDWSVVAGRDVVIWRDNDEPGWEFARAVADLALKAGAASVKIVKVPEGAPEAWDLADPLPVGWTCDTIEAAIRDAVTVEPPASVEETAGDNPEPEEAARPGAQSPHASERPREPSSSRASARDRLLTVAAAARIWRCPDGEAYTSVPADGHVEHHRVRSREFRDWLLRTFSDTYTIEVDGQDQPAAANRQALAEALDHIEARALGANIPIHQASLRSVGHQGNLYIDRGTADWSVIEVRPEGWGTRERAPVPILRARRAKPLPTPEPGGSVNLLSKLLPSLVPDDFRLVVMWMLAALQPRGPYPILNLNGEQGSGKSTLSRALRRLTDPAGGEILQPPGKERDLVAAARHNHVLAFDNLSGLSADLADALCRLATGAEIGGRGMYTDHDLATFTASRPTLINGIPDLATRPDLASRSVVVGLAPLAATTSEGEFWREFDAVAGRVMGALLDGLSAALRLLPTTPTPQGHRMADFARLAMAAAPALGWDGGEVVKLLRANADDQVATQVDADVVAEAVLRLVEQEGGFEGLATALHRRLTALMGEAAARQPDWPKRAHFLVGSLMRAAPALRRSGVVVTRKRTKKGSWLSITVRHGTAASPASPAATSVTREGAADVQPSGDAGGAGDAGDARPPVGLVDREPAGEGVAAADDGFEEFRL